MPALGFVLAWGGYAVMSWGYCLVRGYDVSFTEWVNPVHWYAGGWPPPTAPPTVLVPDGQGGPAAPGSGSSHHKVAGTLPGGGHIQVPPGVR